MSYIERGVFENNREKSSEGSTQTKFEEDTIDNNLISPQLH